MMNFKPGNRVVQKPVPGTVYKVTEVDDKVTVTVKTDAGTMVSYSPDLLAPAEPLGWPPQVGDVWVDDEGFDYSVRHHRMSRNQYVIDSFEMKSGSFSSFYSNLSDHLEKFLDRKPTLVRRRPSVREVATESALNQVFHRASGL